MITKSVEVNLRVFERLANSSPGEFLISGSISVLPESCENVFPLLGSQKPGGRGAIMDKEVCSGCCDNGYQTFLERRISCHAKYRNGSIHDNENPPPTIQTSDPPHFGEGKCLECRERSVMGRA